MRAVIAALPRELSGLVRGGSPDALLKQKGIALWRLPGAVLVAAGMGAPRVTLAVEAALRQHGVSELISAGLAGACGPALSPGVVRHAVSVVDVRTGERYSTEDATGVVLASAEAIASVREKARLHEAYGAAMVDMEAATVARLAKAHGIGFRAVKAISDGPEFALEHLSQFAGRRGEFRTAAFALHTALRPWTWSAAMELGRASSVALRGLTERLNELLVR